MSATKKTNNIPAERISLYQKLVATNTAVELKGASMPYTSLNGHMFSFLDKEGNLALRLPAKDREEFIIKYKTRLCEQHGTVLKEYVWVPGKMFKKTDELRDYFAISLQYVSTLKPKATKR